MDETWHRVESCLPCKAEDFFGAFQISDEVLMWNGKSIDLGHLEIDPWGDDEVSLRWLIRGPDLYEKENVTHWRFPPDPPTED